MIREQIQNSPEFQANAAQQDGTTVQAGAGTVVSFEKTDLQFVIDVATLVLLYLIWRELQRG